MKNQRTKRWKKSKKREEVLYTFFCEIPRQSFILILFRDGIRIKNGKTFPYYLLAIEQHNATVQTSQTHAFRTLDRIVRIEPFFFQWIWNIWRVISILVTFQFLEKCEQEINVFSQSPNEIEQVESTNKPQRKYICFLQLSKAIKFQRKSKHASVREKQKLPPWEWLVCSDPFVQCFWLRCFAFQRNKSRD